MSQEPKAIVSAILIRRRNGEVQVFIQTRWKPAVSPMYSGMLEIPAGAIDAYENIYDALRREVKEECGLEIVKIINDYQSSIVEPRLHDRSFVFRPFICQEVLETNDGLPWIGFVFLCEVEGEASSDVSETRNPRWMSTAELAEVLKNSPEQIFPLQFPALKYFIEYAESNF